MTDEYIPDEGRALVRVYALPPKLTDGYCFGAGIPIMFRNVDWFTAGSDQGPDMLTPFIKGKRYYRPDQRFLVLGDRPDLVFTIEPEPTS